MGFDIKSMKQRARDLMHGTRPSPILIGIIFAALYVAYEVIVIATSDRESWPIIVLITELVYLIIRNSCKLYGLKVTREETTGFSDVFIVLKKKTVSLIIMGIILNIFYMIGLCLCMIGFLVPFYCLRFSIYIVRDESGNFFKALGQSVKLLKGHYLELLKLDVSNIGWIALEISTLGLAAFYVKPYLSIVYAEFYEYLKAQNELFR